jgi:hypothetical protein
MHSQGIELSGSRRLNLKRIFKLSDVAHIMSTNGVYANILHSSLRSLITHKQKQANKGEDAFLFVLLISFIIMEKRVGDFFLFCLLFFLSARAS